MPPRPISASILKSPRTAPVASTSHPNRRVPTSPAYPKPVDRRADLGQSVRMSGQQPASPHAASALELKAQIEAEREGLPFLIYRDGEARHRLHVLVESKDRVTLGRRTSADLAFPWDEEVSRLHAELVRSGEDWTLSDDGLSLN